MSITHKKVSSKGDSGDTSLVRPTDWNDKHDTTMWKEASDYTSISNAVTAIGATQTTLIIDAAINASNTAEAVIVPATLTLMPISPGVINKGSATSLTINGSIVGNPMHQWLSGFAAGNVVFGSNVSDVSAEWLGSGEVAINILRVSLGSGGRIVQGLGTYTFSTTIDIGTAGITLEGKGRSHLAATYGTTLQKSANLATGVYVHAETTAVKNLRLDCNNKTGDGFLCEYSQNTLENIDIHNVGTGGWAVVINAASLFKLTNIHVVDSYQGLYIKGTTGSQAGEIHRYGYSISNPGSRGDGFKVENTTSGSYNDMFFDTDPGGKAIIVGTNNTNLQFKSIYIENTNTHTVDSLVTEGTGIKNISFDGLYINHGSANLRNMISIGSGTRGFFVSNAHFLTAAASSTTCVYVADASEVFLRNITSSGAVSYFLLDSNNTPTYTTGINIDGHTAVGYRAMIRLYGFNHSIKNCKNTTVLLNGGTVHDVVVENMDSNCNIEIGASAYDITLINCKGVITIASGATNIVCINCTGSITGTGANAAIKIQGQGAANADTSGATLGQLETEVNELKATLRSFGFITT